MQTERADVQDAAFTASAAFASLASAYLSYGTLYLLTCIPDRSALTRALIIIFALPCRAMSRPGAPTEKFTCRLNEKTRNVRPREISLIF